MNSTRSIPTTFWLWVGAAALITVLIYLPTLRYGLVWDDTALIEHNRFLDQASILDVFVHGFWHNPDLGPDMVRLTYYRPLVNLSFLIERWVWGLNPAGYHLTNVLLQGLIVLLIGLLMYLVFGSALLAVGTGLVFGVHPAWNSVVAFISGRTYLFAQVFLVASLLVLLCGQCMMPKTKTLMPMLLGAAFLLALLALESALMFIPVAGLWLLLARPGSRRLGWAVALVLALMVYLALRFAVARVPLSTRTLAELVGSPLTALSVFGHDMLLIIYPFAQKVVYAPGAFARGLSLYTLVGGFCLALPLWGIIRKPCITGSLGWTWMVLFLLPFTPLATLGPSGRMLYLAAPGVMLLARALVGLRPSDRFKPVLVAATAVLAGVFAARTIQRNELWRNSETIRAAQVREAPESAPAYLARAEQLHALGQLESAIAEYRKALDLNDAYVQAHAGLAHALADQGDFQGSNRELAAVLHLIPGDADAHTRRAINFARLNLLDSAVVEFRVVASLMPNSADAHNNLGLALRQAGALEPAIVEYLTALRLDPGSPTVLNNLGAAQLAAGDHRAAIQSLRAALRLDPGFVGARANLHEAYLAAGLPDSAAALER